jgi:acyl carrier protein
VTEQLIPQIRLVLSERAGLATDAYELAENADLYAAGMSSFASVDVMLGLEDSFGLTFPDAMLKRSLFESISAIAAAVMELRSRAAAD